MAGSYYPTTSTASGPCRTKTEIFQSDGKPSKWASPEKYPLANPYRQAASSAASEGSGNVASGNTRSAMTAIMPRTWITSTSIPSNTATSRNRPTGNSPHSTERYAKDYIHQPGPPQITLTQNAESETTGRVQCSRVAPPPLPHRQTCSASDAHVPECEREANRIS